MDSPTIAREAFYDWALAQPSGRYERIFGHVVRMPGEAYEHLSLKTAIFEAFRAASLSQDHVVLLEGMGVAVDDHDFEPDVVVHRGGPIPRKALVVPNPVLVVEVLSPSTECQDLTIKRDAYLRLPSIEDYLVFHADERRVLHWRRGHDAADRPEHVVALAGLGITLDLAAIYDRAGVA